MTEQEIVKVKRTYFANVRFIIEEKFEEEPLTEKGLVPEMATVIERMARKFDHQLYKIRLEEVLDCEVKDE